MDGCMELPTSDPKTGRTLMDYSYRATAAAAACPLIGV